MTAGVATEVTRLMLGRPAGPARADGVPEEMVDTIEEFRSRLAALDWALTKGGALDEDVLTQVQHLCTATFSTFERHARGGGEHVAATAAYVTGETLPHLMQSGFMNRARTQPRGYAGDFLTIEMIYRNVGVGDGRMGRFLDGWGLSTSPCIAVRKRRAHMAAMLSGAVLLLQKPSLEIMSLGSGPAREVIDALTSPNGPRLRPTCVDVDQGALDYASSLARGAGVVDRIRLVRENIIRLSLGRGSFDTSPQDLIYSLGLIDYLRDELVVSLLSWIHGNLRPGGIALVGNFARSNPNRAFMDHILEWRLFHRDPDDLRTLFAESQFGDSPLELGVGDEGVQLYARCRKAE